MNCYNGEAYLRQALDSVFSQTFNDWEIVFVDNCSTDESIEIAKRYGDKVNITSTDHNISLGAARNFGITQCEGDYIAFLDTDDIWLTDTLDTLVSVIKSGDYALAYGGQLNINSQGNKIRKMLPKMRYGNLFQELLKQYDIPIVASMVSKKFLLQSGLSFDANITTSEEYCLFMQLAARYEFISVDKALVKYRIHDNSLTNMSIFKWAEERRYTLDKIINAHPGIEKKYPKEFNEAFARAAYYESQSFMSKGDVKNARRAIKAYIWSDVRYFFLYVVLLFRPKAWRRIMFLKYGRNYGEK